MRKVGWLSYWLVVAVLGCSGDAPPPFRPKAAPGWAPFSSLSPDQVQAICVEQGEYVTMLATSVAGREAECRSLGRGAALQVLLDASIGPDPTATPTDADIQRTCQTAHDTCLAHPPLISGPGPATCARTAILILSDCAGTVDEYAACETALLTPFFEPRQACSTLTVDALTPQPPSDAGPASPPPACQGFWAKCPPLEGTTLGAGIGPAI